jgi:hypothetical protein
MVYFGTDISNFKSDYIITDWLLHFIIDFLKLCSNLSKNQISIVYLNDNYFQQFATYFYE